MFCPSCGKSIAETAKFCPGCGANMREFAVSGKSAPESEPMQSPAQQPAQGQTAEHLRSIATTSKRMAADIGKEAQSSFRAVYENPTGMAASHSFSLPLSLTLIVAEVLLKVLFVERAVKAFLTGAFVQMSQQMGYGEDSEQLEAAIEQVLDLEYFETKHYFYILLIMAIQTAFFVALICFLPKLLKNARLSIAPQTAVSTIAFASVPWSAAILLSSIALTLFSFGGLSVYIMFGVCGAALVASILLLHTGLAKFISGERQRLAILAAGYGVQLIIVMWGIFAFIPERVTEALSELI